MVTTFPSPTWPGCELSTNSAAADEEAACPPAPLGASSSEWSVVELRLSPLTGVEAMPEEAAGALSYLLVPMPHLSRLQQTQAGTVWSLFALQGVQVDFPGLGGEACEEQGGSACEMGL